MKDGKTILNVAVDWLLAETAKQQFGEVLLKIIIHNGEIARIERGTVEKQQQ